MSPPVLFRTSSLPNISFYRRQKRGSCCSLCMNFSCQLFNVLMGKKVSALYWDIICLGREKNDVNFYIRKLKKKCLNFELGKDATKCASKSSEYTHSKLFLNPDLTINTQTQTHIKTQTHTIRTCIFQRNQLLKPTCSNDIENEPT